MNLIKNVMLALMLASLAAVLNAQAEALPKALILTGNGNSLDHDQDYPPWMHEFQNEKVVAILEGLVEVDISEDLSVLNNANLKKYDLIISNSLFLMPSRPQLAALKKFITSGKSLLTLHSGLLSFLNADYYEDMMGGIFIGGPSTEPESFKVVTENNEFWGHEYSFRKTQRHPVSIAVEDFTARDELYYFQPNTPDLKVIARAENHPVMWEHTWKKGRVMNLILGHDLLAKNNAGYQALLKNGVLWLTGYPLQNDSSE